MDRNNLPDESDRLNSIANVGNRLNSIASVRAILSATALSMYVDTPSGPLALFTSRPYYNDISPINRVYTHKISISCAWE